LECLRRDIVKNSRVINEELKEWCQTIFEKADEMYGTYIASGRVTWLLDNLKFNKFGPVPRAATLSLWLTNEKLTWNDKSPKECVDLAGFHLHSNSKLQPDTRRKIPQFIKSQKTKRHKLIAVPHSL
jgi:hypothetical protein